MAKDQYHFSVNSISYTTANQFMLPKDILVVAGLNINEYYLAKANNPSKELAPEKQENIHDGEEFIALIRKATPVS